MSADEITVGTRRFVSRNGEWVRIWRGREYVVVPATVQVRFSRLANPAAVTAFNTVMGAVAMAHTGIGTDVLEFDGERDVTELMRAYLDSGLAEQVEPVTVGHLEAQPNDPLATTEYQYQNFEHWEDLKTAWDIVVGCPEIIIGILDTGVDLDHDDLRDDEAGHGNLWRNWADDPSDTLDNDGNGYVNDRDGWDFCGDLVGNLCVEDNDPHDDVCHGTCVAGLIGATTNNEEGIAGMAGGWWEAGEGGVRLGCQVMPVKVGYLGEPRSDAVAAGIRYAADNGADILNMSFTTAPDTFVVDAVMYAADTCGLILTAAAGNGLNCASVGFPATMDEVLAVGAVARDGERAQFSCSGSELDIMASTGRCINPASGGRGACDADSTYPHAPWQAGYGPEYGYMSGTSCAAPQVGALAGLLACYDSSLDRDAIKDLICRSAEDQIGDEDDTPGWDERYGWGRINAYQALFLARGGGATTSNLRLCYDVTFDRDVYVSEGDTLTLLPGVTVTFTADSDADNLGVDEDLCELIVEGTLVAIGEDGNEVTFTSDGGSAGSWYGVRVAGEKADAELRHAVVEHAYKGVSADEPSVLAVAESVVQDCVTHGIYLEGCGSSAEVDTNLVVSPGLVGIEVRECEDLVILGNRIEDATAYGVKCTESYGVTVEADTILGAEDETSFIGIYYKPAAGDSTYSIVGNEVRRAGSRGISVEYGSPETALIEGNVVTDDGYDTGAVGAYFYASGAAMRGTTVEEKSYGVVALVEKVTPVRVPDLGRDETGQEGENRFVENEQYHIYTDIVSPDTLKAEQNWYGSASPSSGKFSPQVDWHPYLTTDPGTSGRRVVPPPGAEPGLAAVALGPARPNPFGRGASLGYSVPGRCEARLGVYSASGREVAVLAEGERDAGLYEVAWDGVSSDGVRLPSGVYFVRLEACGDARLTKLVLLK